MADNELTPLRLDAIMDGEVAVTDEERAMLALAAQLRADVPQASHELRERVSAIGDRPARSRPRRRLRAWSGAPALGAVVVALIAGAVAVNMIHSNGSTSTSAGTQATGERSVQSTSETTPFGAGQTSDRTAPSAQPSKDLSSVPAMERTPAAVDGSAWTLPSIAIDGAITDLRAIARDRQLTIRASSTATSTQVEIELPSGDARASLVSTITDVLVAHDGVANTGPITLAPEQAVLVITLADAK